MNSPTPGLSRPSSVSDPRRRLAFRYLQKQIMPECVIWPAPRPGLKLCVVIPSLAERKNLPRVLDSLQANQRLSEVEVIVLVNNAANAPAEIVTDNLQTLEDCARNVFGGLRVLAADYASPGHALPAETAGVGLARRAGLDLGFRRLWAAGSVERAALACLDADSPAGPGYLDAILNAFDCPSPPVAGYGTYAHPRPEDPRLLAAVAAYELWLRYLVAGFKVAHSWFAFPTIGSCMAVSALAYAQVGGLEPRKAAEDFHFLRKLAKFSGSEPLTHIRAALVYPQARVSERVPFGTGRAMLRSLTEGDAWYLHAEPPEVFLHLREFFARVPAAYHEPAQFEQLPVRLLAFLETEGAWSIFEKFRRVYPGPVQFTQACQHWFDSLRIVRYANELTREQGRVWIFSAWRRLLEVLGQEALVGDLPLPTPGQGEVELYWLWLERLRKVTP